MVLNITLNIKNIHILSAKFPTESNIVKLLAKIKNGLNNFLVIT